MLKRELGNTGEEVTVIGLGCWQLGQEWTGMDDDKKSIELVHKAYDLGVNFFDVAPVYGFGHAEKVLGQAIADRREDVFIASKVGLRWDDQKNIVRNLSPESIRKEIEDSLKRLDTDYIDLYQMHWPDPNTPIQETMEELSKLKEEGKIRYIGASNFNVPLLEQASAVEEIVSNQVLYSILDQNSEHYHGLPLIYRTRDEIMPYAEKTGMSVIPYSPVCQGMLTDSFDLSKLDEGDVRYANPELWNEKCEENYRKVQEIKKIAEKYDKPLAQLAFNWLRKQDEITSIIAGVTKIYQIEDNVASVEWELSDEDMDKIDEIMLDKEL